MIAQAEAIDTFEADLEGFAEEIRQLYRQTTVLGAIQIGERLEAAHAELSQRGNGRFGKWVAAEFTFSRNAANEYRRLYLNAEPDEVCHPGLQTLPMKAVYELFRHPKAIRQQILDEAARGKEFSPAAVKAEAKRTTAIEPAVRNGEEFDGAPMTSDLATLAGQKFGTIYADPPWKYGNSGTRANVKSLYKDTMTIAEICAMPIAELAAEDCHLHLWTTSPFLPEAFKVIEAWGFTYKSSFVWVKPQMGIGNYWRISHEFLLLGVRGNVKNFPDHRHMSWMELDREGHSSKPEEVRQIIESVSPGKCAKSRLELFGRSRIAGWTVFGNEFYDTEKLFV